jgi:hypothetical protein
VNAGDPTRAVFFGWLAFFLPFFWFGKRVLKKYDDKEGNKE